MAESDSDSDKVVKRRRDPERTRESILEVAGRLLAKDGPEGLSVSQVAQIVGVNRGTAYHHFKTREQLLKATTKWVSEKLCRDVFGRLPDDDGTDIQLEPQQVIERLASFAMDNPEYGRVWLGNVLNSRLPKTDPFWVQYKKHMDNFVDSEFALPDIDSEVVAVLVLTGVVLWPVWQRAGEQTATERKNLVKRFTKEVMRLNLHGSFRKEKFPELDRKVRESVSNKND